MADDTTPPNAGHRIRFRVEQPDDERRLVGRIRAGDVAAFESLFAAHYARVYAFILAYVHAPDVAEELTQDVFAWVWQQRARWEVKGRLDQYLCGAGRNRALDYLKHEGVASRYAGVVETSEAATPADELHVRELHESLRRCLDALPPRQRQAVTLRIVHGLSNVEVAKQMGVSVKTVEYHLVRGLEVVRDAMRGELDRGVEQSGA